MEKSDPEAWPWVLPWLGGACQVILSLGNYLPGLGTPGVWAAEWLMCLRDPLLLSHASLPGVLPHSPLRPDWSLSHGKTNGETEVGSERLDRRVCLVQRGGGEDDRAWTGTWTQIVYLEGDCRRNQQGSGEMRKGWKGTARGIGHSVMPTEGGGAGLSVRAWQLLRGRGSLDI